MNIHSHEIILWCPFPTNSPLLEIQYLKKHFLTISAKLSVDTGCKRGAAHGKIGLPDLELIHLLQRTLVEKAGVHKKWMAAEKITIA